MASLQVPGGIVKQKTRKRSRALGGYTEVYVYARGYAHLHHTPTAISLIRVAELQAFLQQTEERIGVSTDRVLNELADTNRTDNHEGCKRLNVL